MRRPGPRVAHTAGALLGLIVGLLSGEARTATEECRLSAEQGGMTFPVEQLDTASRCRLSSVVDHPTTSGTVPPVRTPVSRQLYDYLLDHPSLTAALAQRLGLGKYEFTAKGKDQYWGNDGDGTQGLLSLIHRDGTSRMYDIDGYHEGRVFPLVRVKAVIFLKVAPVTSPDGKPAVETAFVAYTKLNDPVLSGIVWILRPLIGGAITEKLGRGFEVTKQLAGVIAGDPDRILRELPSLPLLDEQERQVFSLLLREIPQNRTAPSPPLSRQSP
jgi:hypothetical protein